MYASLLHFAEAHKYNNADDGWCVLGLLPTCRVQPKLRWRSAAAQYTLSSGPTRGEVRIHVSLFTEVEGQHGCCLHVHKLSV